MVHFLKNSSNFQPPKNLQSGPLCGKLFLFPLATGQNRLVSTNEKTSENYPKTVDFLTFS